MWLPTYLMRSEKQNQSYHKSLCLERLAIGGGVNMKNTGLHSIPDAMGFWRVSVKIKHLLFVIPCLNELFLKAHRVFVIHTTQAQSFGLTQNSFIEQLA